jgi:hypothetical protein
MAAVGRRQNDRQRLLAGAVVEWYEAALRVKAVERAELRRTAAPAATIIRVALVEDDAGTLRSLQQMVATDAECLLMGGYRTVKEATEAIVRSCEPDKSLPPVEPA